MDPYINQAWIRIHDKFQGRLRIIFNVNTGVKMKTPDLDPYRNYMETLTPIQKLQTQGDPDPMVN